MVVVFASELKITALRMVGDFLLINQRMVDLVVVVVVMLKDLYSVAEEPLSINWVEMKEMAE